MTSIENEGKRLILGKLKEHYEKRKMKSTSDIPIVINVNRFKGDEKKIEEGNNTKIATSKNQDETKVDSSKIELPSRSESPIKAMPVQTKKKRCRFFLLRCFF
jgi:hypothetical protein